MDSKCHCCTFEASCRKVMVRLGSFEMKMSSLLLENVGKLLGFKLILRQFPDLWFHVFVFTKLKVVAVVERVLKICTQVQLLLHCWNNTQLQVKVLVSKRYLSKSTKYSSQKLLRVLVTSYFLAAIFNELPKNIHSYLRFWVLTLCQVPQENNKLC